MAIPIGTTARQISRIARWTLTGVVTIGMLSWWWPSFEAWGSLVGGLLAVFTLWVLWRVVVGDRAVPGHPLHLAMAAPAVILVVHLVRGIANRHENPAGLSSAMDASMIFQFAVLALGVMLSQSLLPKATEHASVLSVCGGAMILGSLAAIFLADPGPVRSALALLGFAGIAVWLSPLWTRGGAGQLALSPGLRARLRRLCVVLAVLAAGALGALSPEAALVTGAVVGGIVLAAGGVFRGSRRPLLACGSLLLAGVAAVIVLWRPEMPFARAYSAGVWGRGEAAFAQIGAAEAGLVVLGAVCGWGGLLWLVGGMLVTTVWLLGHAHRSARGDLGRALTWTSASVLAACAMLAPGGLFLPAVTLSVAFTWGLLPAMLAGPQTRRPGAILLVLCVGIMLLLAVARNDGLIVWAAGTFGFGERMLHAGVGFFLGLLLALLMGVRKVWLGLAGIVLAAAAGGLVEWAQKLAGTRTAEWKDWFSHALGSAAVLVPYLLAMGARGCESRDVRPKEAMTRYDVGV